MGQDCGAVLAHELKPAAVPEPSLAARVLDDAVERDVLADHDLSHLDSPCIRGAPRAGTASNRVDATARPELGAATPPNPPARRRLYR